MVLLGTVYYTEGPMINFREVWRVGSRRVECGGSFDAIRIQILQLKLSHRCDMDQMDDFFYIYDGPSSDSPLLFISSCSDVGVSVESPLLIFTSTNQALLRLESSAFEFVEAFTVDYECINIAPVTTSPIALPTSFTSVHCPVGQTLNLKLKQLLLDGAVPSCSMERIQIFNRGLLQETYCGVFSESGQQTLTGGFGTTVIAFTSDGSTTGNHAEYILDFDCSIVPAG